MPLRPSPGPSYDIDAWRRRIPLLERFVPMNACSHGPPLDTTLAAAGAYLDSWSRHGMDWEGWMAEVEAARASFAALVGAEPDDVAVLTSVSHATAAVASALSFDGPRNRVAVTQAEFPSVAQVWLAQRPRGAVVDWVPVEDGIVPPEGYQVAVDERTLLVSACHAYYQSGFKQDLRAIVELARDRGALVYVDAYQTLGTEPVDVKALDVDFLASGCLKYLMGVPGIAFLYVKPEVAARLEPGVTGWFGRADPFAFRADELSWASGGRRFDGGTPPVPSAYVARPGIEAIRQVGPAAIRAWTEALSARLIEGGRRRGLRLLGTNDPARKAPSTAFAVEGDSHAVEAALRERGILASARGPVIRLAPHFYSTTGDVDRALDALSEVL